MVIDGLDGRGHYVNLPTATDLGALPVGGIFEVRAGVESIADRNIAAIGRNGLYLRHEHLNELRASGRDGVDAEDIVAGHMRRLEALRRAGVVERVSDGVWRVPTNLVERGRVYDRARLGDISLKLHSYLPIEKQVHAIGATWLDRQLLDPSASAAAAGGFAAAVRGVKEARVDFLVKEGLADRRNQKLIFAKNLLGTLRAREIVSAAKPIAADTGLVHRPVTEGSPVSGVYRRSIMLASGRFAMLSDGLGFSLVPWRPVIEPALGRAISAVVRDSQVDWRLGRQRGIAI